MPRLSGKNRLILSTTTAVNLLTVSSQVLGELERRIQEANSDQGQFSQNSLQVAKLELAFLLSKDLVSFKSENLISERNNSSIVIYTLVQVKNKTI